MGSWQRLAKAKKRQHYANDNNQADDVNNGVHDALSGFDWRASHTSLFGRNNNDGVRAGFWLNIDHVRTFGNHNSFHLRDNAATRYAAL